MTEATLYDNDAIKKLSVFDCWGCLADGCYFPPAILKVATFSIQNQAKKARSIKDADGFRARLQAFLDLCEIVEPTEEEVAFATDLEERAAKIGGELDSGESQLIAVLVHRAHPFLVTGDKRALQALADLEIDKADERIVCLEQALRYVVENGNWEALRASVCAERGADRSAAMVFGCHSDPAKDDILMGLDSYIDDLRKKAGKLLVD